MYRWDGVPSPHPQIKIEIRCLHQRLREQVALGFLRYKNRRLDGVLLDFKHKTVGLVVWEMQAVVQVWAPY